MVFINALSLMCYFTDINTPALSKTNKNKIRIYKSCQTFLFTLIQYPIKIFCIKHICFLVLFLWSASSVRKGMGHKKYEPITHKRQSVRLPQIIFSSNPSYGFLPFISPIYGHEYIWRIEETHILTAHKH